MRMNGVFEGGGVKGIALTGAVSAAMKQGFTFHQVAGTSSGAIVASFLAAGYSGEEMRDMILQMPFQSFLKRSWVFNAKLFGPASRLMIKKGLYSGEALENWVNQKLAAKGIRTFGDLAPDQLQIVASDISQGKLLVLPQDIAYYGIDPQRLLVAKAVRMSTSIPYFFDPVMIRKTVKGSDRSEPFYKQFVYIVDGGLLSNFPLWIFDRNYNRDRVPTFGFQLVGSMPNSVRMIKGPITMLQALFSTMLDAHDQRYIEQHNRFRTVKIQTLGVQVTDFNLSEERSLELYDAGYEAAERFFQKWTLQQYENEYKKYVL